MISVHVLIFLRRKKEGEGSRERQGNQGRHLSASDLAAPIWGSEETQQWLTPVALGALLPTVSPAWC